MNVQIPENAKKLNAAALKWIAIVTMLIDHSAKALLYNGLIKPNTPLVRGSSMFNVYQFYRFLRGVGRLAFPIFCFFIVEGFVHTRNKLKYLIRILIFGILSELPFDMGLYSSRWYTAHQNVMYELALGLVMLWLWETFGSMEKLKELPRALLQWGSAAFLMWAAQKMHLDYGYKGLGLILILYITRFDRIAQCVSGAVFISLWEWQAVFAFVLLSLYNGERGKQNKYFFYAFYPAHLFILYELTKLLTGG